MDPTAGFATEPSDYATKHLISKMGLREIDCEDRTGS